MSWLEDLAKEQGYASLRALAQAVRASSQWPVGDKRNIETVANKLRDADKGKDIAWWSGTGHPLLRPLADVLHEDEPELVEQLQRAGASPAGESAALWTSNMFRALRPIDLRSEDPFPGVPDEIVRLGSSKVARTWWITPTGAGKSLVGRWLAQRHGWTVVRADRWTELEIPTQGRVFVELASTADISAETLDAIPQALKICIAAPHPPPTKSRGQGGTDQAGVASFFRPMAPAHAAATVGPGGFHVVAPPPPHTWVRALVRWAAARVKPGGGFDAERLQQMFRDEQIVAWFETPGDLLGFLGLVDHVGLDRLEDAKDPLWWIRVWMNAALERSDRRPLVGIADLLGKRGPEILVQIEVERLRRGLAPSLSESEWIDLVPREQAPDVDRDRLLALLDEGASDVVTQVRTMLAPDSASVVRGLKATGALAEGDTGRLVLRPAWIANAITGAAVERLYNDAPDGLGTLLLFGNTSEAALRRLIADVRAGEINGIGACVATESDMSPEKMAALDGAFRAVGFALLAGTEVPLPLVHKTWSRQMMHVFERFTNWPPVPILTVAAQDHWHGVTAIGAWFIAAFAISRALFDAGIDVGRFALNPWGGLPDDASERDACAEALTNAASPFRANEDYPSQDPLRLTVYDLGGSLFDRHGIVRRYQSLLDIQGPDLLVALAAGTELEISVEERQKLLQLPFGLEALENACRRRESTLESVLAWCWSIWGTKNGQWLSWLHQAGSRMSSEDLKRIWSSAPASALSEEFYRNLEDRPGVWHWLTEPVLARWLEVWSVQEGRWAEGAEAFRWVPKALALQAVRDGRVDPVCHDIRRVLWARMPEALIDLVDELSVLPPTPHPTLKDIGGPISDIVVAAPGEHCRSLIERARTWISVPSQYPGVGGWLRRWLIRVVEQRSPGWREAYELLTIKAAEPAPDSVSTPVETVTKAQDQQRSGQEERRRQKGSSKR